MSKNFLPNTDHDLQRALEQSSRKMIEEQTQSKARSLGLSYVNLQGFPVDLNVLSLFSESKAQLCQAVPFFREGHDLRLAATNPKNPALLEEIKLLSNKYKVSLYLISEVSLMQTIQFYKKVVAPVAHYQEQIHVDTEEDFLDLAKRITHEATVVGTTATQIITDLFSLAMRAEASDIHLEPEDGFVKVRLRLDGVLQEVAQIPKQLQKQLTIRIKVLSKLKINVENQPQDGRMTFLYLGRPIDIRVAVLPGGFGEGLVLRLLGVGAIDLRLPDLGLRDQDKIAIEGILHRPNGMVITTGPTGSGKTTTLYAFLNQLNEPGVKIITLEDPIEYKLSGIQQTPIDHHTDFNFAKGLRAVLRQDPDIIMVGEIRDQETAETALQAALTGHVVLSTLHTNDAAGAIPRLITMNVKPFVIAPAINAILAQRLVRKLCEVCKVPVSLAGPIAQQVQVIIESIPKAAAASLPEKPIFYHAPGCQACNHLGYKGRIGLYEVLLVTETIQELILKEPVALTIKKAAVQAGMVTLVQDGMLKALSGITDVEEVFRVAGNL
jgi:type IV pilus assembly protein PilB